MTDELERPTRRKCPCRMTEQELFEAHGVPYEPLRGGFQLPRVGDADEQRRQIVDELARDGGQEQRSSDPEHVGDVIQRVRVTVPLASLRRVP